MPTNPFGNSTGSSIGSTADLRALQSQSRMYRTASRQLKEMLDLHEKTGAAATASAQAAAAAIRVQNDAILGTNKTLSAQGKQLRDLDQTRERYHQKEIKRAKSLAYHYEEVKDFLIEIREDADDSSSVLGFFFRGWKEGADNLITRGKLPIASQQIRDVNADLHDLSGTAVRAAGAASDLGKGMYEQFGNFYSYVADARDFDDAMLNLASSYGLSEKAARQLGETVKQVTKVDLKEQGKEAQKLADDLGYLQRVARLSAEEGAEYAAQRFEQAGVSLSEAGHEMVLFTVQADMMREALQETHLKGKVFSGALRDDFVRAMMEAHRQFTQQTADLQNVAAAYQWAQRKALEYGLSAKGASKFATAFGQVLFKQDTSPETMLAGAQLQSQISQELEKFRREKGIAREDFSYRGLGEGDQDAVQERIAARLGIPLEKLTEEMRTGIEESIFARGEGLGAADIANMLAFSKGGIEARLDANRQLFGNLQDTSALSRILKDRYGIQDLDTTQARRFARMIRAGDTGGVADEILELRKQAEQKATEEIDRTKDALKAVISLQDPVQELFNIKNILKAMLLNFDSIGELLTSVFGGDFFSDASSFTDQILGAEEAKAQEAAKIALEGAQAQSNEITEAIKAARAEYDSAGTSEEKEAARKEIVALGNQLADQRRIIEAAQEDVGVSTQEGTATRDQLLRDSLEGQTGVGFQDFLTGGLFGVITKGVSNFGAGIGRDVASMLQTNTQEGTQNRASGAALINAATSAEGSTTRAVGAGTRPDRPGQMAAAGNGRVEVGTDGRAVMSVTMNIENMGEVIAYEQGQARAFNAIGVS